MDGKTFAKLCKDCQVISKACTTTDIDLIFAKVKAKASRKISFCEFEAALDLCAQKLGQTKEGLLEKILSCGGPVFNATKADKVKFHDDKSLYTGVYAKGGPTNIGGGSGGVSDISELCNRGTADVRGVMN
jgi:hypothetical protein